MIRSLFSRASLRVLRPLHALASLAEVWAVSARNADQARAEREQELMLELQATRAAHAAVCSRLDAFDGREPGAVFCSFCGHDEAACEDLVAPTHDHGPYICDVCASRAFAAVQARRTGTVLGDL